MFSLASFGLGLGRGSSSALRPTTPVITVDSTDNAVTVTIAGDSSVTNYVVYKKSTASGWTAGGSRAGDGDVTVSDLDYDCVYIFSCYSIDPAGSMSEYAIPQCVSLSDSDEVSDIDVSMLDDADIFLDAFGEPGTYMPRGGGERAITIIVDREGVVGLGAAPSGQSGSWVVSVKNSSAEGISTSEIDTGGDKIKFANRLGETPIARRIIRLISQDTGMMQLELR